jgi:hypothetical protein
MICDFFRLPRYCARSPHRKPHYVAAMYRNTKASNRSVEGVSPTRSFPSPLRLSVMSVSLTWRKSLANNSVGTTGRDDLVPLLTRRLTSCR